MGAPVLYWAEYNDSVAVITRRACHWLIHFSDCIGVTVGYNYLRSLFKLSDITSALTSFTTLLFFIVVVILGVSEE